MDYCISTMVADLRGEGRNAKTISIKILYTLKQN